MNEQLARKAHTLWSKGGLTYSQAVDAAFVALNSEYDAADLFGIPADPVLRRHQEGVVQPPAIQDDRAADTP